jgi:5'-nucleotidase
LDEQATEGPLLPPQMALNVNFPDELDGATWRLSQIGSYNAYQVSFVENMAASPSPTLVAMARQRGMEVPPLPGLSFGFNQATPLPEQANDESIVYRTDIAVSPMQAGYAAQPLTTDWLARQLGPLLQDEG